MIQTLGDGARPALAFYLTHKQICYELYKYDDGSELGLSEEQWNLFSSVKDHWEREVGDVVWHVSRDVINQAAAPLRQTGTGTRRSTCEASWYCGSSFRRGKRKKADIWLGAALDAAEKDDEFVIQVYCEAWGLKVSGDDQAARLSSLGWNQADPHHEDDEWGPFAVELYRTVHPVHQPTSEIVQQHKELFGEFMKAVGVEFFEKGMGTSER